MSDDVIYRRDAIDKIAHATFDVTIGGRRGFIDYKKEFEKAFVAIRDKYIEALESIPSAMRDRLEDLPSTQPEPLTDKEQRIFLSAMERERKVCRQVDEECRNSREPYEDSLVHVCNEIERKVKGALWT